MRDAEQAMCVCGHRHLSHEHYRGGSDCSLCLPAGCRRFRSAAGARGLLHLLLSPAARGGTTRRDRDPV